MTTDEHEEYQNARVEGFIPAEWEFEDYLLAEVKRLLEENDALSEAISNCIITQMNSVENGNRYQGGGCFEHYSYWEYEKESDDE